MRKPGALYAERLVASGSACSGALPVLTCMRVPFPAPTGSSPVCVYPPTTYRLYGSPPLPPPGGYTTATWPRAGSRGTPPVAFVHDMPSNWYATGRRPAPSAFCGNAAYGKRCIDADTFVVDLWAKLALVAGNHQYIVCQCAPFTALAWPFNGNS